MENTQNAQSVQEHFNELSEKVEQLSDTDKKFVLWLLLREYQANINVREHVDTVAQYREFVFNRNLHVSCNEIIEMLSFELWV